MNPKSTQKQKENAAIKTYFDLKIEHFKCLTRRVLIKKSGGLVRFVLVGKHGYMYVGFKVCRHMCMCHWRHRILLNRIPNSFWATFCIQNNMFKEIQYSIRNYFKIAVIKRLAKVCQT